MHTNPNDTASPSPSGFVNPSGELTEIQYASIGMTKREHLAAQALPACIASLISAAHRGNLLPPEDAAQSAVEYADLLIAELNKENREPRNKKVAIHLLSAQIVNRVKGSEDSVMNLCQVVENLIREANL